MKGLVSVATAALVATVAGVGGTLPIVLAAAQAVGATPEQASSWVSGLGLATALSALVLSVRYRMPIITAWSTPGAALIASTVGIGFRAAVGAFGAFEIPKNPQYSLVSRIDSISLLRRDHKSLLDPSDRSREFFGEKGSEAGESLMELPNHIVLDRGRIVGIWEYDAEAQEIVWVSFIKKNKDLDRKSVV